MKRLRTLQEAVLTDSLWFQFGDAPVELRSLKGRWAKHADNLDTVLRPDVEFLYHTLVSLKNSEGLQASSESSKISHAVHDRSLSVASDEAICLGNLLQLNFDYVYKAKRQPRMEDVWRCMPFISPHVIFSICPRLQAPGFNWAPSTFLGTKVYGDLGEENATVVPGGLEVSFPGLILQRPISETSNHFHMFVDDSDSSLYDENARKC